MKPSPLGNKAPLLDAAAAIHCWLTMPTSQREQAETKYERDWHARHLGVGSAPWGMWDTQAGPCAFSPFKADTDYFAADRQWMLNLRVDDLDGMIASLGAAEIEVITKPEWDTPGVGGFARIHDPEGNPIELWQPDDPA